MKDNCKSCKQWYEHVYWEHNGSKDVRFCKTMGKDFSQRMSIPEKFIARFKEKLPKIIHLKGPGGMLWHVGIARTSVDVFLQNGWNEFAEAHHLEQNDVLVFNYEGNFCFTVTMFDSSGTEKESSYFVQKKHKHKAMKEHSLEILEPIKARVGEIYVISEESAQSNDDQSEEVICPRGKAKKRCLSPKSEKESTYGSQSENSSLPRMPGSHPEENSAMQLARAFTPTGPSFLKVMQGYNVLSQFQLLLSPDFAHEFLPRESTVIILRLPNTTKEWKVNYSVNGSASRFIGKWRIFTTDNNLKVGDVCVFELSNCKKQIVMTVHIFRL